MRILHQLWRINTFFFCHTIFSFLSICVKFYVDWLLNGESIFLQVLADIWIVHFAYG